MLFMLNFKLHKSLIIIIIIINRYEVNFLLLCSGPVNPPLSYGHCVHKTLRTRFTMLRGISQKYKGAVPSHCIGSIFPHRVNNAWNCLPTLVVEKEAFSVQDPVWHSVWCTLDWCTKSQDLTCRLFSPLNVPIFMYSYGILNVAECWIVVITKWGFTNPTMGNAKNSIWTSRTVLLWRAMSFYWFIWVSVG